MLEAGDIGGASEKFDRAMSLNGGFSPVLVGKALAVAMRAGGQGDADYRDTDREKAFDLLKKARSEAEGPQQRFIYEVTAMRVYLQMRPKKWLSEVEDHYEDAVDIEDLDEAKLPYYSNRDAASYFMGLAWYRAYEFRKAEARLAEVVGARAEGKWQPQANALYAKVQRIVRASAGHTLSDVASKIAVKDQVTRADVATLVVTELKVDKLFAGRIPVKSDSEARAPEFVPVDIQNHPFRSEIETAMKWDMRGLVASYDSGSRSWLFRPATDVSRKELALIFEDVLIKMSGDEDMATAMIGTARSPFPDVPPEVGWFNAVSTVTSRGLMEPDLSGEFRPEDPADGPELLLGVFKLRHVLNIH